MMRGHITMTTMLRVSSLLRDMMSTDPLPFGAKGIRTALILLNACVLLAGCALCVLGSEIDTYLELRADIIFTPVLWWLGVGPIVIGFLGIGAGVAAQKRWVTIWVATAIFLGSLTYIIMSSLGCLDSQKFGVAVQVFGQCRDHMEHCICIRDNGRALLLNHSTCADARHVTRLYVAMVTTLTLCITCLVTSMVLACVGACCVQHCQDKFHTSAYCETTTCAYSPGHLGPPSSFQGGSMLSLNESPDMLHPTRYLRPERSTSYISLSPTTMVTEIGISGRSSRTNSVAV